MCMGMMNYRKPKEEKVSLLKKKMNFDRIKEMNITEMSYMLMCPYDKDCETDDFCQGKDCIECTRQWLESEAK